MQAASDIFLGWQRVTGAGRAVRDYYLRQLRDMKGSADVEALTPADMSTYAGMCGRTVARAHARSGDRIAIASYLGSGDTFDLAIADFAQAYADPERTGLSGILRRRANRSDRRRRGSERLADGGDDPGHEPEPHDARGSSLPRHAPSGLIATYAGDDAARGPQRTLHLQVGEEVEDVPRNHGQSGRSHAILGG